MRRITKPKPQFKYTTGHPEDLCILYGLRYKGGNQLTESHFSNSVDAIDLDKLDSEEQILTIRGQMLPAKVWMLETDKDLDNLFKHIEPFKYVMFDTETTNIKLPDLPSILLWSITVKPNEGFVIPFKFNNRMLEYMTTTNQSLVAHNLSFDMGLIHNYTGKFIQNYEDTLLYARGIYNDSVVKHKLSLKELVKKQFGIWSDGSVKSKISDLTEDVITDDEMIYYSGVDTIALYSLFQQYKADIEAAPTVHTDQVLPADHPKLRSYSRAYYYKNVAKQLIPLVIEFQTNGLPIDKAEVTKLDAELDIILDSLDAKVVKLPTVMRMWEEMKHSKAKREKEKYLESVDATDVKMYKPTNTTYINLFVSTLYPEHTLPSKAKNWTFTIIKTFDTVLAEAIRDKDLERLRHSRTYSQTFIDVETVIKSNKIVEKQAKIEQTANNKYNSILLDLEFKPLGSAQQKKYILNKGYNISSTQKSSNTGEDSFNKEEISMLLKELNKDTELYNYVEMLYTYSGAAIIKKNFVKNLLLYRSETTGCVHASTTISGTKSNRPTSSGKLNMLNLP